MVTQREWSFDLPWLPVGHDRGAGSITFKADRDGDPRYFIRSRRADDPDGGPLLRRLVEYTGAPNGGALLAEPLIWLDAFLTEDRTDDRPPEPIPGREAIEYWQGLLGHERPSGWLRERGIRPEFARHYGLGWDPRKDAVSISVLEGGEVVNVRWRYLAPKAPAKIRGLRGRGSQLWPGVPESGPVLLCEGEFDALLCRQHGIPAVTSTAGTSWKPEWTAGLVGRRVAVLYDTGSERLASKRAFELSAGGVEAAWPVSLAEQGLRKGEDITDLFTTYRWTAPRLLRLIRDSRPRRTG